MRNKINVLFFWILWIWFLEIIYKLFIIGNIFTIDTLKVMLFSLPFVVIFSLLSSIFKNKVNRVISIILCSIITVLFLAQIVYYNFYDSIFSFFSLTTGTGQVMQFWSMILSVCLRIWYIFVIILIPFILFIIFGKKIFGFNRLTIKNFSLYLCTFILAFLGIFLLIYFDNNGVYNLKRLLFKTHAPMLTIKKTGLLTMQSVDLYRYIFSFEEETISEEIKEVKLDDTKEYNVYNINFDELISNTSNDKINNMHKYFSSVTPSEKNKYTGLFKGKNLIFITAEGFDTIAIDKDLTPTLYKMANNGFVFNNYYQPLYPVSTSDGEYMNLTSLVPKEGVWSFYKSSKISMPLGFGTMFKNNGYTSYGFHNHTYKYYDRHLSHPNIGLTYIGCGNGLEKKMNCKHWPNSDVEMIDATIDYYLNEDKPFATYYMTVSGHLNYNFGGNNMASRNKKAVKNINYSTAVKAYMATQIELDKAMEKLINYLDEASKLDDTLIVMGPDHYPYGLTLQELNEKSEINRKDKFENYHTSVIMYNPSIEKTVIDKYVCGLDLLPTIYNLFGIEFDSRLLMGRDMLSDSDGLVMLSDRSWITNKGKYNSVTGKFVSHDGSSVDNSYIEEINSIVNKKFSMSSLILDNNYYNKVGIK